MTAPNNSQFDSLCGVCGKKITPGHTHEGQSPEQAAALAGNANATNFCFHCGEPGSYEEHEAAQKHTCGMCGEPGTASEHEITGHHTGGTCPRCGGALTATHNCLKFTGVTTQRKRAAGEAVAQSNVALGNEGPRYEITTDPDTGLSTRVLTNPEAFATGTTKVNRQITATPGYMGLNPHTGEMVMAFDDSGAAMASQHAAGRGSVLSQPHRNSNYVASLSLLPGVEREGRGQGVKQYRPSDIVPHVKHVEMERGVYDEVPVTRVDKNGKTVQKYKTKNGKKTALTRSVQRLDKNGQPVKEKYIASHSGVMAGGFFYKDTEIKNLTYSLKDRSSGFKQVSKKVGKKTETTLVPKTEAELDSEHLAKHNAAILAQTTRDAVDQKRVEDAAAYQRTVADRQIQSSVDSKKEIQRAHREGEHKPDELAAAIIEARSRHQELGGTSATDLAGLTAPGAVADEPLKLDPTDPTRFIVPHPEGVHITSALLRQAGYPRTATGTRQVYSLGNQVGTTATPYIGAPDPNTGERPQGVDVRPVHRAIHEGTEPYQYTEEIPSNAVDTAHENAVTLIRNAIYGRLQRAMDSNPQVGFDGLSVEDVAGARSPIHHGNSSCKECSARVTQLLQEHKLAGSGYK